jgi:hypothetical protein
VLHPSFLENTAFATFVGMPEFSAGNVCDHLVVPMRVKRPDGTGRKCIVIKDAKRAKIRKLRVKVITESEMPPAVEVSVSDFAIDLINALGVTNLYH